jgi:hypothetical protein
MTDWDGLLNKFISDMGEPRRGERMVDITNVMYYAMRLMDNIKSWKVKDGWVIITADGETKRLSEMQIMSIYTASKTDIDFIAAFANLWCGH